MLQLIAIKTKDCVYISTNITGGITFGVNYFADSLLFDGEKAKNTYRSDWKQVDKIPTKIEKVIPPKQINKRWELKEYFPVTENTPKIIDYKEYDEDVYFPEEKEEFKPLYELMYDMTEETFENVPFQITVIAEKDDFKIIKEEFKVQYDLLYQLNTHPVLLSTKPCKISSKESYGIIREYIKRHINRDVAKIESDYDFCLKVVKNIELGEKESYEVDLNNSIFGGKKRKPKLETRYRSIRSMVIYETAPELRDGVYKGYTRTKEFEGTNYENMIENINKYLEDLISEINRPLVDCPHCKGRGVLEKV